MNMLLPCWPGHSGYYQLPRHYGMEIKIRVVPEGSHNPNFISSVFFLKDVVFLRGIGRLQRAVWVRESLSLPLPAASWQHPPDWLRFSSPLKSHGGVRMQTGGPQWEMCRTQQWHAARPDFPLQHSSDDTLQHASDRVVKINRCPPQST